MSRRARRHFGKNLGEQKVVEVEVDLHAARELDADAANLQNTAAAIGQRQWFTNQSRSRAHLLEGPPERVDERRVLGLVELRHRLEQVRQHFLFDFNQAQS